MLQKLNDNLRPPEKSNCPQCGRHFTKRQTDPQGICGSCTNWNRKGQNEHYKNIMMRLRMAKQAIWGTSFPGSIHE